MEEFDDFNDMFGNDDLMEDPVENDKVPTDADIFNSLFDVDKEQKTKRRLIQRPQPKLNESSLVGPKGIPALRDMFKEYKPNKDLDPYSNLNLVMKKYEHWAHLLFPKMKFDDVIARCEALGMRRVVKVYMMKSRSGMPLTDEDFANADDKEDKDAVITTDCDEDRAEDQASNQVQGIITSRDEDDDDENYYDPFADQREEEPDYADFPDL
ncbi:unnamed protein product [Auanema sp. JU1783]|nr:unnamed protein product [Auanema sp. JU1783]